MTAPPKLNFIRYQGLSMWPGFQDGDILGCRPIRPEAIRRGDCLLFRNSNGDKVVHRVVNTANMIWTRGDYLTHRDSQSLEPNQILGQVVRRYRMDRSTSVPQGLRGLFWGRYYRIAGRIDPDRNGRGGRLARGIRRLSTWLLSPLWRKGRLLESADRDMSTYWGFQGLLVGRKENARGTWQIPWPQKLFIDPSAIRARTERS
ncbi:MAG: hypothetical protein C0614_13880 [Desulfuromonas sp.]|nr:MAG: hypothetical protein C0614_13880 [Desulfuromonas sp.]